MNVVNHLPEKQHYQGIKKHTVFLDQLQKQQRIYLTAMIHVLLLVTNHCIHQKRHLCPSLSLSIRVCTHHYYRLIEHQATIHYPLYNIIYNNHIFFICIYFLFNLLKETFFSRTIQIVCLLSSSGIFGIHKKKGGDVVRNIHK